MGKDVKQTLEELKNLYDDSKIMIAKFEDVYDRIVPNRLQMLAELYSIPTGGRFPRVGMTNPLKQPEHHQLAIIFKKVNKYAEDWIKSVSELLSPLEQVRFQLQFENPKQKPAIMPKLGETTSLEERLYDVVSNLGERHAELRQIIIELEKSTENIMTKNMKDIEPATYDKKTRTIFFADEAIRFRKDANYTAGVLAMIFDKPKKLWTIKEFMKVWDDYYEYIGNEKPNDWQKIYQAFKKANERVEKATGISDLFKFSTTSVRLNPAYL